MSNSTLTKKQILQYILSTKAKGQKTLPAVVCFVMLISVVIPMVGMFVSSANNVAMGYNDATQNATSYLESYYGEYCSTPVAYILTTTNYEPAVGDDNTKPDNGFDMEPNISDNEYADSQYDVEEGAYSDCYMEIVPIATSTDLTEFVTILEWDLIDGSDVSVFEVTNQIAYRDLLAFRLEWRVDVEGGRLIQAGDQLHIYRPVIETQGAFTFTNSAWHDFAVGRWRIHSSHVEIEFNEQAAGSASVSGKFETGRVINNNTRLGGTRNVNFMGEQRPVNFQQFQITTTQVTLQSKRALATSANRITWQMDVFRGDVLLGGRHWNSPGTYGTRFENTRLIVENVLLGEFVEANFLTRIAYPRSLTPGNSQYGFVAGTSALFPNFTTYMTRLVPNSGESYAAFRTRVSTLAMQWGVWTSDEGVQTFVAYFGTLGVDNPRIPRVSSLSPNFAEQAADMSIVQGLFSPGSRGALISYFNTMHGDGNVIDGRLSNIHINMIEQFPNVETSTTRSSTMRVTRNGVLSTTNATGVQQPMSGVGDTGDSGSGGDDGGGNVGSDNGDTDGDGSTGGGTSGGGTGGGSGSEGDDGGGNIGSGNGGTDGSGSTGDGTSSGNNSGDTGGDSSSSDTSDTDNDDSTVDSEDDLSMATLSTDNDSLIHSIYPEPEEIALGDGTQVGRLNAPQRFQYLEAESDMSVMEGAVASERGILFVNLSNEVASWSILNLILTVVAVAFAALATIRMFIRKKYESNGAETQKHYRLIWVVVSVTISIFMVLLFMLTQDIRARMAIIDFYTIFFMGGAFIALLSNALVFGRVKNENQPCAVQTLLLII